MAHTEMPRGSQLVLASSVPYPAHLLEYRSRSPTVVPGSLPDLVADALRQQLSMDTSRSFLLLVPLQWLDVTGLSDSPESSNLSTHTSV